MIKPSMSFRRSKRDGPDVCRETAAGHCDSQHQHPDEKKFVQNFLEKQQAISRNFQFCGNDSADTVRAFGADWAGGVPFTVLIDTSGEVLYKTQGDMQPLEVRRAILKALPDDQYVGQHAYWNSVFSRKAIARQLHRAANLDETGSRTIRIR